MTDSGRIAALVAQLEAANERLAAQASELERLWGFVVVLGRGAQEVLRGEWPVYDDELTAEDFPPDEAFAYYVLGALKNLFDESGSALATLDADDG